MFNIEYRAGASRLVSKTSIRVCDRSEQSKRGEQEDDFTMWVSKSTLYEDLQEAETKVLAAAILWAHKEASDIYVMLSPKVLAGGYSAHDLEHILARICLSLGMNIKMLQKTWVIAHKGPRKQIVEDIVERIKKVFAGKILAMYPANVATPTMLCDLLGKAFLEVGADVLILDDASLHEHGFGLITGIGDSATNPPRMMVVRRDAKGGGKKSKTIGVIGKGVTFDSGGLAVKPFKHMHDMKYDKIGAIYACMTLLYFLEKRDYDHHTFLGVFPFVENAISQRALRPGDVITSFSGKTVEITNPDAEGRLILADALSYIQKYKPNFVLDMATLTGHASSVSCWHAAMFYTHTPSLVPVIKELGEHIGERVLDMPHWKDHRDVLESDVADLSNSPMKCSDATVAAMFLDEFVDDKLPWVHLDLAHETEKSIPSGNGIRTAIRIIEHICAKK